MLLYRNQSTELVEIVLSLCSQPSLADRHRRWCNCPYRPLLLPQQHLQLEEQTHIRDNQTIWCRGQRILSILPFLFVAVHVCAMLQAYY